MIRISVWAAIFLVLLRIGIGWHFFFEGVQKVESVRLGETATSKPFSSAGYFREKFFQVFNYRFDAGLSTVLTTAASDKELDPRIKSRIFFSDACQVHVLKVGPYRGKRVVKKKAT